jgi:hypothetical protein
MARNLKTRSLLLASLLAVVGLIATGRPALALVGEVPAGPNNTPPPMEKVNAFRAALGLPQVSPFANPVPVESHPVQKMIDSAKGAEMNEAVRQYRKNMREVEKTNQLLIKPSQPSGGGPVCGQGTCH